MTKINIVNDLIRVIPFNEEEPWVEVDDETLQKIMQNKIVAKNGQLIDNTSNLQKQERIIELKKQLADTDYQAIKHSEGLITDADYEEIKEYRQAWRDEINELEEQL